MLSNKQRDELDLETFTIKCQPGFIPKGVVNLRGTVKPPRVKKRKVINVRKKRAEYLEWCYEGVKPDPMGEGNPDPNEGRESPFKNGHLICNQGGLSGDMGEDVELSDDTLVKIIRGILAKVVK